MAGKLQEPYFEQNGFLYVIPWMFERILGKIRGGLISLDLVKKVFKDEYIFIVSKNKNYKLTDVIVKDHCDLTFCPKLPFCPQKGRLIIELNDPDISTPWNAILACAEVIKRGIVIRQAKKAFLDKIINIALNVNISAKKAIELNKTRKECVWCGSPTKERALLYTVVNHCMCTETEE
ncbi:MAG TPA: hypothetical protein ENI23_02120 [bacterium]|nr:hypothetical protein [bacterium]